MFGKKKPLPAAGYDKENWKPVLKCSICNGEQVAGFRNLHSGKFKEECFIRNQDELLVFKQKYGITGEMEKIY